MNIRIYASQFNVNSLKIENAVGDDNPIPPSSSNVDHV